MSRLLGAVLVVFTVPLTLASVLTGVVYLDGVRAERQVSQAIRVDQAPAMTVFIHTNTASVTVVPGSSGQVVVDQDVSARGLTRGLAEQAIGPLTSAVSGAPGAVSVRSSGPFCCWASLWVTDVNATMIVRLPSGAGLTVETGSGDVSVSGVFGPGAVSVRTQSGRVHISGAEPSGNIDVQTATGAIVVDLAAVANARLDAATRYGGINVDPRWPVASSGGHATGSLGTGSPSILLRSDSGEITIGVR
jgi:hypothetical protein